MSDRERGVRRERRWGAEHSFLLALVSVVALFLATELFGFVQIRRVDVAATDIADNAAPSMARLAELRVDVQRALSQLTALTGRLTEHRPLDPSRVLLAQQQVDRDARAYVALPAFPDERKLWASAAREINRLDRLVTSAVDAAEHNDLGTTRMLEAAAFRQSVTAGAAIADVIELNAHEAERIASEIKDRRHGVETTFVLMTAFRTCFAALAAIIAFRSIRQYQRRLRDLRVMAEDRADELDQFASRAAHDIRSPLATLSMSLSGMIRAGNAQPPSSATIERCARAIARLDETVGALLAFARAGARPVPGVHAELREVINDLVEEVTPDARARHVEIRVEPFDRAEIACSPTLVRIALSNLVSNAIKYMGDSPQREIRIRAQRVSSRVRVYVEDSGPGIPSHLSASVFEPYVRGPNEKEPGLGLGLATVRRVCERHGGFAGVQPGEFGGSTFWIEIPAYSASRRVSERRENSSPFQIASRYTS